jgi:hypothetical protein
VARDILLFTISATRISSTDFIIVFHVNGHRVQVTNGKQILHFRAEQKKTQSLLAMADSIVVGNNTWEDERHTHESTGRPVRSHEATAQESLQQPPAGDMPFIGILWKGIGKSIFLERDGVTHNAAGNPFPG